MSAISVVSAEPRPDISVSPTSIDFGDVETGTASDQIVTISNVGSADLQVTGLSTANVTFSVVATSTPFILAPGGLQDVTIRFSPTIAGVQIGDLEITSDDPDQPLVTVSLTGNGTEPLPNEPDIGVSPASLDFGQVVVGSSSDLTATVTNNGLQTLTVSDLSATNAAFTVVSPVAPFDVAASGGAQTVTVRFSPALVGIKTGDLHVTSNDPDQGVVVVSLTGEGVSEPIVELRISAGGADYTDINGDLFVADKAFVAGDFGYSGGSTASFSDPIAGTTDDALYQTGRGASSFSYEFDDLPAGDYQVTLYFTEPWWTSAGKRLLDVSIEGVLVLDNFDIFAASGGKFVAHAETFLVNVTDGQMSIEFTGVLKIALVGAVSVESAP